jgi:hypothetical protein
MGGRSRSGFTDVDSHVEFKSRAGTGAAFNLYACNELKDSSLYSRGTNRPRTSTVVVSIPDVVSPRRAGF